MRWKAYFCDKDEHTESAPNFNYGFKTEKSPPAQPLLIPFENDIYAWLNNIKFKFGCIHLFRFILYFSVRSLDTNVLVINLLAYLIFDVILAILSC